MCDYNGNGKLLGDYNVSKDETGIEVISSILFNSPIWQSFRTAKELRKDIPIPKDLDSISKLIIMYIKEGAGEQINGTYECTKERVHNVFRYCYNLHYKTEDYFGQHTHNLLEEVLLKSLDIKEDSTKIYTKDYEISVSGDDLVPTHVMNYINAAFKRNFGDWIFHRWEVTNPTIYYNDLCRDISKRFCYQILEGNIKSVQECISYLNKKEEFKDIVYPCIKDELNNSYKIAKRNNVY